MTRNTLQIREHSLMPGSVLYCSDFMNILIGCPPEILKVIFKKNLTLPDTIIVTDTLYHLYSSQTNLEFLVYHFLFVQKGLEKNKKLKILSKQETCEHLAEMLRVTLLGPTELELNSLKEKLDISLDDYSKLWKQILKETHYLALKGKKDNILQINEIVEFIPLNLGDTVLLKSHSKNSFKCSIHHVSKDQYRLEINQQVFKPTLQIKTSQKPCYKIDHTMIDSKEKKSEDIFTIRCIGSSNGFDPKSAANGFIFHYLGKWILWDCPVFTNYHLSKMNISLSDFDAVVLSHVHEDHLDVMETLIENKKTPIYTTPEIFHSAMIKLMMVLECSYDEAVNQYQFVPIIPNHPFDFLGATAEFFYSVHSIPALGFKLSVPKKNGGCSKIFFSGDTLSVKASKKLEEDGIYNKQRKQEVVSWTANIDEYDISFVDAGSGLIHGDFQDYSHAKKKIYFMHTGEPILETPKNKTLLQSGEKIMVHK